MGDRLFSYDTAVLAASGAVGSVTASCITMPLTTAFTRLQLEDKRQAKGPITTILELVRDEGFLTLYRGCQSTLLSISISNFVYFYSFHGLKKFTGAASQNALKDLLFACTAGCINVLLTNPLWVVNSRLKMAGIAKDAPKYRGTFDGLCKIALQEGLGSLWNGTKASLMLVSNPAIKFTVYELFKRQYLKVTGRSVGGSSAFLLGAAATAVATILTYPLQIVQAKARHGKQAGPTLHQIAAKIIRENGASGLFKGVDSKLLQSALAAGFMFLTYEKISAYVLALLGSKQLEKCH
eukprot:TRINITY_DN9292_c0_g1_i1.p1 TRINITY_DN9292_c0_g1~~TRINITY_DN9292_c0_g1_i1.p1  ORF type:complete len:295 (+),score=59.16 TRINITY_DN9292_c0_g1_i1:50-934(+)